MFVPSTADSFTCRRYKAEAFATLPKIMACDIARYGDDKTVVGLRQGRQYRILGKYRGLDLVQVSDKVIGHLEAEEPDAFRNWDTYVPAAPTQSVAMYPASESIQSSKIHFLNWATTFAAFASFQHFTNLCLMAGLRCRNPSNA